jgi:site-specific DNA recombinase
MSKASASQGKDTRKLRCAIYTRVSSDAGLEQEFNSLDNQREAAEAHVRSQQFEGWQLIPARYDDGGYSGGSMERPGLQKLLADVQARLIDVIVVYKVDRLTRSLTDFAKLVELFDQHGVSFVSVTQSFNTTTSMGRLTLNVLLSFAQFEREVTGERIRDKIAASKQRGIWMGGNVPYGYRVENRKLLVVLEEAEEIRTMFQRYLDIRSVPALAEELKAKGFRTRIRPLATGRIVGGIPLTQGPLATILKNRVYLGEINHRGKAYPGEHRAIIDPAMFDRVQATLAANINGLRGRFHASGAILMGRIFDDRGNKMMPSHTRKGPARYRYYVSCAKAQNRPEQQGTVHRVSAHEIEELVVTVLRNQVAAIQADVPSVCGIDGAVALTDAALIEAHLHKIVVAPNALQLSVQTLGNDAPPVAVSVPWKPTSKTRRRAIIAPAATLLPAPEPIRPEARARLIVAIARARSWVTDLTSGKATSTAEIASCHGISERSVRMTLSLAFLAPAIVDAAINRTLPNCAGLTTLSELSTEWRQQMKALEVRSGDPISRIASKGANSAAGSCP